MAKFFTQLDDNLITFIREQKIFFCATADAGGRINLSPKGMDTFRILSPTTVGFLSLTGSGNETAAHLKTNGRITIMFCSFTQQPLILRIYGTGRCIYPGEDGWDSFSKDFDQLPGTRQIFIITVESLQTSCGFSIPFYEFKGERDALVRWSAQKGEDGIKQYWRDKNRTSIDGLKTGMDPHE
ncbi:MAG: pyridoxamine 5'-phosphate oxidase family protein [Candidatus Omnitrophota bacterium]